MKKYTWLICTLFILTMPSCNRTSLNNSSAADKTETSNNADYTTENITIPDITAKTADITTTGPGAVNSVNTSKTSITNTKITTANAPKTTKSNITSIAQSTELMPKTTIPSRNGSVDYMNYANARSSMSNTIYRLLYDKKLTVGYIGGSVTDGYGASGENNCWRVKTEQWFKSAFPNAQINAIKASIGGTGSGLAMYRLDHDLLKYNPDLVFIEFAVNDAYIGYSTDQIKTHIETIYRKIYNKNPYADILMVYVSDNGNNSKNTIPAHEAVAEWYNVNSIRVFDAVMDVIKSTGKRFNDYFIDSVHPNDNGYKIYTEAIISFLQDTLKGSSSGLTAKKLPAQLTTTKMNAVLYRATETPLIDKSGWGKDNINFSWLGSMYGGSVTTSKDGSRFTIKFKGTDFGILYEKGPNIGSIRYFVDGGAEKTLNGNLSYSNPSEFMLASNLKDGEHTVTITFKATNSGEKFSIGAFLVAGTVIQ